MRAKLPSRSAFALQLIWESPGLGVLRATTLPYFTPYQSDHAIHLTYTGIGAGIHLR